MNPKSIVLTLLAAPLAAGSAWLCAAVAKYGVHLDPSGVNALAFAGVAAIVGLVLKLIHELERKQPKVTAAVEQTVKTVERVDPQLVPAVEQAAEQTLESAWPPVEQPAAPAVAPLA